MFCRHGKILSAVPSLEQLVGVCQVFYDSTELRHSAALTQLHIPQICYNESVIKDVNFCPVVLISL